MNPCTCYETPHRAVCPVFQDEQQRLNRRTMEVHERMEQRAVGGKVFRSSSGALGWYYRTREAWSAPKAMPFEFQSGPPGRGSDSPGRRAFAAIANAIKAAIADEKTRSAPPAPIEWWLELAYLYDKHVAIGGTLDYERIALKYEGTDRQDVWTTQVVRSRMARAHRVVKQHLGRGGWLEAE